MKTYFLAVIVVILSVNYLHAQQLQYPKTIKAKGDYIHASTGTVFPDHIDNYIRKDVAAFDKQRNDICASYELKEPYGKTDISVYIYSAGEATDSRFRNEFFNCLQAIAIAYDKKFEALQKYSPYVKDRFTVKGYNAYADIGQNRKSILALYECGKWFLKVRVTSDVMDSATMYVLTKTVVDIFDPVRLVIKSSLKPKMNIQIASTALMDSLFLGSTINSAYEKMLWAYENVDSLERISGFPDLYIGVHIAALKGFVAFPDKYQQASINDYTKRYRQEIQLLIDNGFLDEFIMDQFNRMMVVPPDMILDFESYYKWRKLNPIHISMQERYFAVTFEH